MVTKYTDAQIMVSAAAREIADNEIVFVGMRLPLLGFLLAKSTHAPGAIGVYELGVVRETPYPEPILTMGDLPNLFKAGWLADTSDIMGLLQKGRIDVSFIGGAQVDRFGNLNTSYIGDRKNIRVRLTGSGGACDLTCLSKRHIIIMKHEKRRFVDRVDYITSPGFGNGPGSRQDAGLKRGGPSAVITTLGVFRFDPHTCEMTLSSIHPRATIKEIVENTGWPLKISDNLTVTPPPLEQELNLLKYFDPNSLI